MRGTGVDQNDLGIGERVVLLKELNEPVDRVERARTLRRGLSRPGSAIHNDARLGRSRRLKPHVMHVHDTRRDNAPRATAPLKLAVRGKAVRLLAIGLGIGVRRRRFLADAPVIKHLLHAMHPTRRARAPENHVVVLRTVKGAGRPRHAVEQLAANRHEVHHAVLAEQELGRDLRLKEHVQVLERTVGSFFHQILVAIEHVDIGLLVDGLYVLKEQVRLDKVVVVEEAAEVARSGGEARVRVLGDPEIFLELHDLHALIEPRELGDGSLEFLDLG